MRILIGLVVTCGLLAACGEKQTPTAHGDGGEVVTLAGHDVSLPLRDLVNMPQPASVHDADEFEPARRIPHPHMRKVPQPDPVVQSTMGLAPAIATNANFEGMGAGLANFTSGGVPPDTDGDIGPNHYVQVVNTSLTVFSRTGTVMLGPSPTGSVFTGFVGACGQSNDGDATIRYDHLADRWVIAQFSIGNNANGPYYQCVAVSTSPDPTGTYARYQFNYQSLNDYPKIGLWPDGYYFTFNMFNLSAGTFLGGKVCAMDRVKMLAGAPDATMQCFDAGENYGGLLASDVDGHTPPPVGSPNYVVGLDMDTSHAFWKLHVDFTTPANSTFTGPTAIAVSSYTPICGGGGTCVTQPSGGAQLASLADRAMNRFVYRRFADHESLLLTHSVIAGTGGGIRWYEIRNPSTTPTVFQQGTYAPDNAYRWIPSIAMDGAGEIAVVYTVSSATIMPSIRFAAHTTTDAPGVFGTAESKIVDGKGVQGGIDRWGDYAALNIDPVDDCTFWATHEYYGLEGQTNWRTRIASFQLPNCGSFALPNSADETVSQQGSASYPIATTTSAGAAQMLTMNATGLPTGVTATFTPASVMSGTSAMITLTADATAPLGLTHYTISATSPTSSFATTDVALTVTAIQPPDAGNGNGSDNGSQGGGCCEASNRSAPLGSILIAGVVLGLGLRRRRT